MKTLPEGIKYKGGVRSSDGDCCRVFIRDVHVAGDNGDLGTVGRRKNHRVGD